MEERITRIEERLDEVLSSLDVSVEPISTELPTQQPANEEPGFPVEIQEEALVASKALLPVGYVRNEQNGQAEVFLSSKVELDHVAFMQWSKYFDFGEGRPYSRYETRKPSTVMWDPVAKKGQMLQRGTATVRT